MAVESQHELVNLTENGAVIESSIASAPTIEEPPVETVIPEESAQTPLEAAAQIDHTEPEPEMNNRIASSVEIEGVLLGRPALGGPAQSAVEAPALAELQTTDVGAPIALIDEDPAAEPTRETGSTGPDSVEGAVHPIPVDTAQGLVSLTASEGHDLASVNGFPIGSGISSSDNHDGPPPAVEEIPITVEPPTPHIATTITEEGDSSMEAAPAVDGVLTETGIANKQGLHEIETESDISEPHQAVADVVEDAPTQDDIITRTVTEEEQGTEEENIQLQAGQAASDDLVINGAIASAEEAVLIEESQDEGEGHATNVTAEMTPVEAEAETPEPASSSVIPESNPVEVAVEDNTSLATKEALEISSGTTINPLTV